jgi:hypothetical protein
VGCVNSTERDTIVERALTGFEPLTWERGFLDSFDGRRRYFWHNPKVGWWDVATQLRNHELARVQRALMTGKYVYHYTTLPAFKSILESQEFWLTDYAYLNDSSEVRHGVQLAREGLDAALSGATPETAAVLRTVLDTPPERQPRICVSCFSFARDSLTQWKGYGREHVAVAIGIEPKAFFHGLAYPRELSLAPIIYDLQAKRELLSGFLHDWAALRDRDLAAGAVQPDVYECLPRGGLFELFSMMKDAAFSDEREFRFVYQEDPEGPISRFEGKAPKRFRVAGDILVPYTTTKDLGRRSSVFDASQSRLTVHEIVVGPHPHAELIRSGICELLGASGYSGIEVNLSSVPFR